MYKAVMSIFAGMALLLGSYNAAAAADIYGSSKDAPIAYAPVAPTVHWTGLAFGGSLGYGFGNSDVGADVSGEGGSFNLLQFDGVGQDGLTYDVNASFDVRIPDSRLLIGIEGGYMGTDATAEFSALNGALNGEVGIGDIYWAALRAGYIFGHDQVLAYGKIGYGWNSPEDVKTNIGSIKLKDREGLLVGGGLEAHLGSGFFGYADYTHFFFDETTVLSGEGFSVDEETNFGVAKVGVKYKFGLGGAGLLN